MFASLDIIVQVLVIITQLFLTGYIATRLGVIALLVTIPVVMVFGLTVYAALRHLQRAWRPPWSCAAGVNTHSSARAARCSSARWTRRASTRRRTSCDVAVYRVADAGFAQIKKLLDGIGMGGPAQALIAAGCRGAVGGQWLVAGSPARKAKGLISI